jgi:hypothetical protein
MITGIWLYWVWVLLALILDYVILNCVYFCDEKGNKLDEKTPYPMWAWLVFAVYPFIPVINAVGFIFLFLMLRMAESKKDIYLKVKFFEDVKSGKPSDEDNSDNPSS